MSCYTTDCGMNKNMDKNNIVLLPNSHDLVSPYLLFQKLHTLLFAASKKGE
jgi:hypothetical protein